MLYQMLFRKYPYVVKENETHQKLIDIIKTSRLEFPHAAHVSEETKDLIKNMLEIEEDARFEWEEINNMKIIKES